MARQNPLFNIAGVTPEYTVAAHARGALKLGALACSVLGVAPAHAHIAFGTAFAGEARTTGTDLAIVAGLLGMDGSEEPFADALTRAEERGLRIDFSRAEGDEGPSQAVELTLFAPDGRTVRIGGSLPGGDQVLIGAIDEFRVEIDGELPVLLVEHTDRPGQIASVSTILADAGANIASMRVARESQGARALMVIETDAPLSGEVAASLAELPDVSAVRLLSGA